MSPPRHYENEHLFTHVKEKPTEDEYIWEQTFGISCKLGTLPVIKFHCRLWTVFYISRSDRMYSHNLVFLVLLYCLTLLMMMLMCVSPASAQKSNGPRVSQRVTPLSAAWCSTAHNCAFGKCTFYNLSVSFKVVSSYLGIKTF